ncbi:type II secretion system GspH family protein [Candidatus Gracilibacteria bacterium]|nr:type II secretion system GspH family protein [Candidatus Gracilibacteria bacterium]
MYKKNAFTFVEIIVSISIVSLIGFSGVFYFQDFIGKQNILTHIQQFENTIDELDNEIKKQEVFDYTIVINPESAGYLISKNNIGTEYKQSLTYNDNTQTGTLDIDPPVDNIWEMKIYENHKKSIHNTVSGLESIDVEMKENTRVVSVLSGAILNELQFNYFEREQINENTSIQIIDIQDNTNTSIDTLEIENISGRKNYSYNNIDLTTPIYIIFEYNGIEETLELN